MIESMTDPRRRSSAALGVIFDGDDTLWTTEYLYDEARSRCRAVVSQSGLDGRVWEERERLIDVQKVATLGYSKERFPTSCVQAYEELCLKVGRVVDVGIVERIRRTAQSVFEHDPPVVPGAKETLAFLRGKGVRLALLTKGDHEVQLRRVDHSGLREFFDVIRIVPEKSPAIVREVVAALGVEAGSAWMIGNSMPSDVVPAVKAGIRAVQIPAHVWEHEQSGEQVVHDNVITTSRLTDVPRLIMP